MSLKTKSDLCNIKIRIDQKQIRQIKEIKEIGDLFGKSMFSLSATALKVAVAVKRFSNAMNNIEMDKRLRRIPQISCKYRGRQVRF